MHVELKTPVLGWRTKNKTKKSKNDFFSQKKKNKNALGY